MLWFSVQQSGLDRPETGHLWTTADTCLTLLQPISSFSFWIVSILFETILNLPSNELTSVIILMLNPFTKMVIIMTHHLLQTVFCWWGDCKLGQIKSNQSNSQIISDVNSTWIISLHLIWWFPTNQILESHFLNFIKSIKHFIISKWPQIILNWPQKNLSNLPEIFYQF